LDRASRRSARVLGEIPTVDRACQLLATGALEIRGRGNSTWSGRVLSARPISASFHEQSASQTRRDATTIGAAAAGILGSKGTFGWPGGATTWAIMDPAEDLVLLMMTQRMGADIDLAARFQTLVYQALID
jgi:CubicO group peptidase (beta-lactamase class C family)